VKRVVVTGMGGISPLGSRWEAVSAKLKAMQSGVVRMADWDQYQGLNTKLAAPAVGADFPEDRYPRKITRSMGRVALLAVRASELALEDAGLIGNPVIASGATGVAYGSSTGNPDAVGDFARMLVDKSTEGINATTYIRMMGHTAPVNIGLYFKAKGRIIPTSSACTSGSQGIGYSYEAIKSGLQTVMLGGGCEELSPTEAAVFDTLFATSTKNDAPQTTPSPFDRDRDGLVIGEGAGTLVLEELEHARARGARIHAELVGFGTNSDGWHVTHPNAATMQVAMQLALDCAGLKPQDIGYINAHGTATDNGDVAESTATAALFGKTVPFSSLKSYMGHTLGACGALEAWMSVMFMNEGWAAPTLNLKNVDPRCGELDYIQGAVRPLDCEYVMSNNFAFGGINTSLIFKRWKG
jgi:3-oxoacyl-[acyl-carrier-protein] synthase II